MRSIALAFFILLSSHMHAQRYGTGLVFNDLNYAEAKIRANFNSQNFEDLPSSNSLKEYCPSPGNQMQLNTSPAWATAWSAMSILESYSKAVTNQKSIDELVLSPPDLYYQIRPYDDQNCEAGIDLYDALQYVKSNQLKPFDEFQEFCPKYLPKEIKEARTGKTKDFRKLFEEHNSKAYKINVVKKSIAQNLPVVTGMHCPPSFFNASEFWQPTEMMSLDFPGQALCIVGYDDEKYGGSFEVINSWGKDWGNNGFIWITYDDFVNFTRYAYEVFYINSSEDKNELSGSIELKLNTDQQVPMHQVADGVFASTTPFVTDTHFRIYLKNRAPAFIYVFGVDEDKQYFGIFPDADNISPALVYNSDELALPAKDKYIRIIGAPGQENLCILYSKQPLDLNSIIEKLSKYPGSIRENLDALLDGKIIDADSINWAQNGIAFNTVSDSKTAVFIQIQINHI